MIFSLRFASMFLASENKPDPLPKTLPSTGFQTREINMVIHLLRGNKPDPPNPLKHTTTENIPPAKSAACIPSDEAAFASRNL
jgi:hypothetical protein